MYLRTQREDGAEDGLDGEGSDLDAGEGLSEVSVVIKDLDVARAAHAVVENGDLDGSVTWALEVVAVTSRDGAVEGGLAAGVTGVKNLEDVPFTTSGLPA